MTSVTAADVDVIVVGGGPVGLAAAIEARMSGLTVIVIEPRAGAIDKACGEGLMPGAVPALARLGVDPPGRPLRGVSYRASGRQADHRFAAGSGRGVRRLALSTALADRAAALGVARVEGAVDAAARDPRGVTMSGRGFSPVRGSFVLAADGLRSPVRGLVGIRSRVGRLRRFGLRRHFRVAPWNDFIEVHWTPDVEAYVTPVADDTVGIAVLGRAPVDFDAAIASVPSLRGRLRGGPGGDSAGAEPASALRGAGPFPQRASRRIDDTGRVLLVGDASGYVDAITGEGIRVGLAQARAAVECIVADRADRYERLWAERTRDFRVLTSGLVAAATSPLRGAIVPTAVALPRVFGAVVERLAR